MSRNALWIASDRMRTSSHMRGRPLDAVVDLDVGLGDGNELRVDAIAVQVLQLVPLVVGLEVDESAVRTRLGRAVMLHRRHEVVLCVDALVLVLLAQVGVQAHLQVAHRKVDNRRVLLHELLRVLREALDVNNQIRRQLRNHVLSPIAIHHFLTRLPVKLVEQSKKRDLRDDVTLERILEERRGRDVDGQIEEGEGP